MTLREQIVAAIRTQNPNLKLGFDLDDLADGIADEILDIPELREALNIKSRLDAGEIRCPSLKDEQYLELLRPASVKRASSHN